MRQPHGVVQGVSLRNYRPGEVYDIPPTLADYLVMENYAILEMRDRDSARSCRGGTRREAVDIRVGATPAIPSAPRRFP